VAFFSFCTVKNNHIVKHTMKKVLLLVTMVGCALAGSVLTSCSGGCCTGQEPAIPLRPAPVFEPIGGAVHYAK